MDYTDLGYGAFDADNHYYEAADSFTRHLPKGMEKRTMQWAQIGGKQRLLVAGTVNRFIPNPLFDPVARPGSLDDYFRGKRAGDDIRAAFGELEPINPGYRNPAARIPMLDAQHIDACFMFPTLGVGMEEALLHDVEACHVAFHSFNQWLLDEWKFDYDGRIFSAPYLCLQDPAAAMAEVEWAIANGARVVVMRSGPVRGPNFGRSPGDAVYDPMWARLAEAGVVVAYHSGDAGYGRYADDWGHGGSMEAFRHDPFKVLIGGYRPIHDTIGALICDGVFTRFPALKVATIESGSDWVGDLAKFFAKSYAQRPAGYGADPLEQLRTNVWVSPYYEDDLHEVSEAIGVEHILFGSDYPHAEGLADPCAFVHDLAAYGITGPAAKKIMRDNGLALLGT
jgi:predicted TIM-barrel fold metal-dependent hydrolase